MSSVPSAIRIWADMVKLSHSVFALPFAVMAAFLAGTNIPGRDWPYLGQLGLVVVCMVAARSVAMTFNRIVDAQLDARNPRTAQRPLPSGLLSFAAAWTMLGLSGATFGVGCLGFYIFYGNAWPILLSGPILLYLCGYSFTKRFTRWSHYYLGSAIALSPVAAWLAIHPQSLGLPAWSLMATVTCWIAGFDIIYACQDIDIDRRDGLYSLPARLGAAKALWAARLSHAVVVAGLVTVGISAELGIIYAVGVVLVAALLIVENSVVRPGDYRHVNVAFFTINGIVSVVLATTAIVDVLVT
ncbi:MAG: 4-hydroxybenzoate octaprenyltransferase [Planctomycetota bacterium]|jgi:4-hydroxybenzoate polyprenyltransferase